MAWLESLALDAAGLGAKEAVPAVESTVASGAARDFNDSVVGKVAGSSFGQKVMTSIGAHEVAKGIEGLGHAAGQASGVTSPGTEEQVNIGSMGNLGN